MTRPPVSRPSLSAPALEAALRARWAQIDVVEQTESTNADLVTASGAPDRTVLVAEHQRAARGRLDRSWSSPPRAGLTFSALFRPDVPLAQWAWLPLLAGVALADAVAPWADVTLKWPNDLLAATGGKLAGILVQATDDAAIIGIGLNVSTSAVELPVPTATSLALAGASEVDRTELLIAILANLDARVAQWADVRGDAAACGLAADYRARCSTLGQQVRVTLDSSAAAVVGKAIDVDELGRLVLRTADGERAISAGDVEHLRPD